MKRFFIFLKIAPMSVWLNRPRAYRIQKRIITVMITERIQRRILLIRNMIVPS